MHEYTVKTKRVVVEITEWQIVSDRPLDLDDFDDITISGKRLDGVSVKSADAEEDEERDAEIIEALDNDTGEDLL